MTRAILSITLPPWQSYFWQKSLLFSFSFLLLVAICPFSDEWAVTRLVLIPGLGVKNRPGSDCSRALMSTLDRDPVIPTLGRVLMRPLDLPQEGLITETGRSQIATTTTTTTTTTATTTAGQRNIQPFTSPKTLKPFTSDVLRHFVGRC